jgi:hypothetical protein
MECGDLAPLTLVGLQLDQPDYGCQTASDTVISAALRLSAPLREIRSRFRSRALDLRGSRPLRRLEPAVTIRNVIHIRETQTP